jgi:hypothetical protein
VNSSERLVTQVTKNKSAKTEMRKVGKKEEEEKRKEKEKKTLLQNDKLRAQQRPIIRC